ncbi:MAG: HAMP domain-containing histidine kinase [Xanthomonadales bacterium]|nr:HAMP domain-containing histidine kinase [Xanthomonadales bacterium]
MGIGEVSLTTLILAVVAGLAIGLAGWLWTVVQSERKRAAAAGEEFKTLQSTQSQVIHTTKLASLGQMIAGVAHEMNTPLGFVKSNVEVVGELIEEHQQQNSKKLMVAADYLAKLARADLSAPTAQQAVRGASAKLSAALRAIASAKPEDATELLTDSIDGLDQLTNLVRNLKGFARVDSDGMDLMKMNEAIDSALTIAQHQLRDRITVVKELDEVPAVRCVPSQINQVVLNLINNASQAMGDGGQLTLRCRRNGDFVELEVEDNGPGIPDDVMPKIFDPFFTTKPVGEGTGLGLSIVHKIVHAHNGNINVKTEAGSGTTFTVSLPVDHAALRKSN